MCRQSRIRHQTGGPMMPVDVRAVGVTFPKRPLAGTALDPSDPYARQSETFPRLTPDQAQRVVAFGVVQRLVRGTVLFECGDRRPDFFLVLDGFVEVYESRGGAERVMYAHQRNQFTGELTIFNERAV